MPRSVPLGHECHVTRSVKSRTRICAIHANFVIIAHKLVLYARKNAHIQSNEQYIYGLTCADLGVDRWIITSRRRVVFGMVNPKLESEAVCDAHGLKIDRLEAKRAAHSRILIRNRSDGHPIVTGRWWQYLVESHPGTRRCKRQ